MKLTKKQAKKLTIKVWSYLRDHPEIGSKAGLPSFLWKKLWLMFNLCPLCEYIKNKYEGSLNKNCKYCALDGCLGKKSLYKKWETAGCDEERQKYASQIVEKTKKW